MKFFYALIAVMLLAMPVAAANVTPAMPTDGNGNVAPVYRNANGEWVYDTGQVTINGSISVGSVAVDSKSQGYGYTGVAWKEIAVDSQGRTRVAIDSPVAITGSVAVSNQDTDVIAAVTGRDEANTALPLPLRTGIISQYSTVDTAVEVYSYLIGYDDYSNVATGDTTSWQPIYADLGTGRLAIVASDSTNSCTSAGGMTAVLCDLGDTFDWIYVTCQDSAVVGFDGTTNIGNGDFVDRSMIYNFSTRYVWVCSEATYVYPRCIRVRGMRHD